MEVGGGAELLLTFAVCGAAVVTVMLGGDYKDINKHFISNVIRVQ